MSIKIGRMKTCDRCGAQVFEEKLDDKALDGGYTHVEQYETTLDWGMANGKHLCPHCVTYYQKLLDTFWDMEENDES